MKSWNVTSRDVSFLSLPPGCQLTLARHLSRGACIEEPENRRRTLEAAAKPLSVVSRLLPVMSDMTDVFLRSSRVEFGA